MKARSVRGQARRLQDAMVGRLAGRPVTLRVKSGGCGLFGDLFIALNGIRVAQELRLRCEIDWGQESLYFEPARGLNVWEYFFEKSTFDFGDGLDAHSLPLPYRPAAEEFKPYGSETVRRSVHLALQEFVKPRQTALAAKAKASQPFHEAKSVLGVHVRGTDATAGHEDRQTVGLDDFVMASSAALEAHSYEGLYVASDEQVVVERFVKEFGPLVHFQDCERSSDGSSLHGHYDEGSNESGFTLGEQVLVDALVLSDCDYLIRTHSRVTCYSLCLAPELPFESLDKSILGVDRTPWLYR